MSAGFSGLSRRTFLAGLSAAAVQAQEKSIGSSDRVFAYAGSFSFQSGPEGNAGHGKGVYLFEADLKTGMLTQREIAADPANPWWLALHPSKKFSLRRR